MFRQRQSSPGAASIHLHRDADRDPAFWIAPVIEVITVVNKDDVDLVVVVPVVAPFSWPRIHNAQPVSAILKARVAALHPERQTMDSESMLRAEITAKAIVRDAVACIATALAPGAMIRLPVRGPMLLPGSLLVVLLPKVAPLDGRAPVLAVVLLLSADGRTLRLPRLRVPTLGIVGPLLL